MRALVIDSFVIGGVKNSHATAVRPNLTPHCELPPYGVRVLKYLLDLILPKIQLYLDVQHVTELKLAMPV